MPQSPFSFGNISAAQLRQNIENAILSLLSNSLGPSKPQNTFAGMWHLESATSDLFIRSADNASWILIGNAGIPGFGLGQRVGDYFWSARESIPKCFKCNGQEISRSTYSELFNLPAMGTKHGAGNGSTTFNIYRSDGRSLIAPGQAQGQEFAFQFNIGNLDGSNTMRLSANHNGRHSHNGDRRSGGSANNNEPAIFYDNGGAGFQRDQNIGIRESGDGDAFSLHNPYGVPGYFYQRVLP